MLRRIASRLWFVACGTALWVACPAVRGEDLHRFVSESSVLEGRPVHFSKEDQLLLILGRDGQLRELDRTQIKSSQSLAGPFRGYSQGEMRAALIAEFGAGYEVTGTGNYLVVHPVGQRDQWANRFETLYREMLQYFSVRGMRIRQPPFPLVAVVFPSHQEFVRAARQSGANIRSDILGYYDPYTNRILLYDVTAGGRSATDWRVNAETIIHEASHQTAFNIGIHNRFTPPPRWVCEGLGTLFEAPGVYDSRTYPEFKDRINREQLQVYRKRYPQGPTREVLLSLFASDDLFRLDPYGAYAASWGLTLMLSEQQPRLLSEYLRLTAAKAPFREVPPVERLRDFRQAFGGDLEMLQARLQRFIRDIPQ